MSSRCQNSSGVSAARITKVPVNAEAAAARRFGLLSPVATMAPAGAAVGPVTSYPKKAAASATTTEATVATMRGASGCPWATSSTAAIVQTSTFVATIAAPAAPQAIGTLAPSSKARRKAIRAATAAATAVQPSRAMMTMYTVIPLGRDVLRAQRRDQSDPGTEAVPDGTQQWQRSGGLEVSTHELLRGGA